MTDPQLRNPISRRRLTWILLLLGLFLPQIILWNTALTGSTILLPLDLLRSPSTLDLDAGQGDQLPLLDHAIFADMLTMGEPYRHFVVSEVRAGRIPLWNPYNYAGSPMFATGHGMVFSPYRILDYLWPSPTAIAWGLVLRALISGIGAYLFFRQTLRVGQWPALAGAWCFPLLGGPAVWGAYSPAYVFSWTPWLLLAVYKTVHNPRAWAIPALAAATAAVALSGHPQVAIHLLLLSGFYGLWLIFLQARGQTHLADLRKTHWLTAAAALAAGWLLGLMIASPQLLTFWDYLGESLRFHTRASSENAIRPGQGLIDFFRLVCPFFYGKSQPNVWPGLHGQAIQESASAGAVGVCIMCLMVPAAFIARRQRAHAIFWACAAVFAAGYCLQIPGIFDLLAGKPLNSLSNNRLVMFAGWALLVVAVIGLDHIRRRRPIPRWAGYSFAAFAATIVSYCVYRVVVIGEIILKLYGDPASPQVASATRNFHSLYLFLAVAAGAVGLFWLLAAHARIPLNVRVVKVLAIVAVAELTFYAFGFQPNVDASLYYPRPEYVDGIQSRPPGRVMAVRHLQPNINMMFGLSEVRGYDAFDPERFTDLLTRASITKLADFKDSVTLQLIVPPGPIADMLAIRYHILLKDSPHSARINVIETPTALPRVYVPASVVTVNDDQERLNRLLAPDFRPQQTLYVESKEPLTLDQVQGTAQIASETPQSVTVSAIMATPGVVVLADRWEAGWKARIDGREIPILRVNHVLRGVVLAPGNSTIEFTYEPRGFTLGLRLAGAALVAIFVWGIAITLLNRRPQRT